jgi:hypothetical protein
MSDGNQAVQAEILETTTDVYLATHEKWRFRRCINDKGYNALEMSHPDFPEPAGTFDAQVIFILFNELELLTRHNQDCVTGLQNIGRTLQIARSLLKEALRNEARLMAPNEYRRKIHSVAQKIGATAEEVEPVLTSILEELFAEMTKPQPKATTQRKRR